MEMPFAAPFIGAFIGYITNYIAVKMLFRPYKEVKLFGKKLPFTPGIIPKRKVAVAKAVGNAVCNNLLTEKDLENAFFSENAKAELKERLLKLLYESKDITVLEIFSNFADENGEKELSNTVCRKLTEKISEYLCSLDIKSFIEEKGTSAVKESLKGSIIEKFASEDFIKKLLIPFGEKAEEYIKENSYSLILPKVCERAESFKGKTVEEIITENSWGYEEISAFADIGIKALEKLVSELIKSVNASAIIETKINRMSEKEIESLVLSVMKNELSAVVNLGAVIGFILGLLNMLF